MVLQLKEENKSTELSESQRRTDSSPDRTYCPHADDGSGNQAQGFDSYTLQDFEEMSGESFLSPKVFTLDELRQADFKRTFEEVRNLLPPVSNTGATPPQTTQVDTVSITMKESVATVKEVLFQSLRDDFKGESVSYAKLKRGVNGYSNGFSLTINHREIAKIYFGCEFNKNQNEKPQIYIGGNGSPDYFDFFNLVSYLEQVDEPFLTRNDIKKDFYHGEVSLEDIEKAYIEGKFKNPNAPKNPKWHPIGDRNPIDGTHYGITYEIGSRSSTIHLRNYLKGYESFRQHLEVQKKSGNNSSEIIKRLFETGQAITVQGFNDDQPIDLTKWLRMELEMKKSNNRPIPIDSLINTDKYFSGAFPYLAEVINIGDGIRPKYMKKEDELDLEVRILNMKNISGSLIEDLIFLGWSSDDIVKVLRSGRGASQKLIRSGLAQKHLNKHQ